MSVNVVVMKYPEAGVVGFEVEESTLWGWVNVLTTSTVGTFPDYITDYEVSPFLPDPVLRARWQTGASDYTAFFQPLSIQPTLTSPQEAQVTQAIIAKATRILVLNEAPLGTWGDMTEFGQAIVRPDYQIQELLFGLVGQDWRLDGSDEDFSDLVTTTDVIRQGLQSDPSDFPAARLPDVQRAIDAAVSWVASYLAHGIGFA